MKRKFHLLWRFVLDGSWPWRIVHIERKEKKSRQSKRVSAFLQQLLIFLNRKSLLFEWERCNESLYFMSSVIVWNEFSSVESITKTMLLRLRLQSVLSLITRTDDRPVLPVIINSLLVVFLSNNYCYMCFLYAKPNNLEHFSKI